MYNGSNRGAGGSVLVDPLPATRRGVRRAGTRIAAIAVSHPAEVLTQEQVLERFRSLLAPGGMLIIKDITTEPRFGLLFTELLDRVMVGWNEPLAYRHHREWGEMLTSLGFKVRMVRVPDILPYPHVVIAARKT